MEKPATISGLSWPILGGPTWSGWWFVHHLCTYPKGYKNSPKKRNIGDRTTKKPLLSIGSDHYGVYTSHFDNPTIPSKMRMRKEYDLRHTLRCWQKHIFHGCIHHFSWPCQCGSSSFAKNAGFPHGKHIRFGGSEPECWHVHIVSASHRWQKATAHMSDGFYLHRWRVVLGHTPVC